MSNIILFIIRGLPGSGKSTLGELIAPHQSYAADDYFYDEHGTYNFDPSKLREAHEECQNRVRKALEVGMRTGLDEARVAVCNTFTCHWEYKPYVDMAKELGARFYIIDLYANGEDTETLRQRGEHGVPAHVYQKMVNRWEK